MIKTIYFRILFFCLLITTSACEDGYLERYPLVGPSADSYFNNESELIMAVNGCYKGLNFNPSDAMPWILALDNTTDISWDRNNSPWQQIGKGSHDSSNGYIQSVWNNFYKTIARCNFILDNMEKVRDKVSEGVYARTTAEVRFIRAYSYHYLMELFGDIPLIQHTIALSESQVPKSPKSECLDFILKELNESAAALPVSYTGADIGRATKGAALATAARAALFNEKWDAAAAAAKAVMDLNYHKLYSNFGDLFSYKGESSTEIIFNLQYLRGTITHFTQNNFLSRLGQGASNKVPGQSMVDSYECTDGLTIDKSPGYNPKDPFKNRDPRLGFSIAVPGSVFYNYQFETNKDSLKIWNYNTTPATRIDNTDATHAYATYTGYCWKKYVDLADKGLGNSELSVILIRYAEVLLTYAEAKIEANQIDQSVFDAINAVRQRPSVGMPAITPGKTQAELRSIVRKERKYELALEGFRLFDIRRWKIADKVMNGEFLGRIPTGLLATAPVIDQNGTPDYSKVPNKASMRVVETRIFNANRDYLWPIPYIETVTNKALLQNIGY